jgi:SAM-dependent methyltransferase
MKNNNFWWQKIFDERYLKIYSFGITEERTNKELKFLLTFIKKKFKNRKIKILDLACGYGRHSLPLAENGYEVIGVDYSKYFLSLAKEKAKELKIKNVRFLRKDIRKINFKEEFDLVINMFTSFGYFDNNEDNIKVLKNVYESLKRGGYFILDLENPNFCWKFFLKNPQVTEEGFLYYEFKEPNKELDINTKVILDHVNRFVILQRKWEENGKENLWEGKFKLFYPEEILIYLKLIGFERIKIFGDFDFKKIFNKESSRMIFKAFKRG